jgi:hypothetical protein
MQHPQVPSQLHFIQWLQHADRLAIDTNDNLSGLISGRRQGKQVLRRFGLWVIRIALRGHPL